MNINISPQSTPDSMADSRPRQDKLILTLALLVLTLLSMGQFLAETQAIAAPQSDDSLAVFDDSEAVFDEAEADFGETEATFDDNTAAANTASGSVPGSLSPLTAPARLSHGEHYAEARYYPDRQPRTIAVIQHSWLLPLALILCMIPLVAKQGKRPSGKLSASLKRPRVRPIRVPALGKKLSLLVLATSWVVLTASSSQAIVYSPVKDAVTKALGKGQKIYQTKITITPEAGTFLKKNLGWSPAKTDYKAYYAKAADGKPQRYAFVLSDKLEICGGLHKYCVAVNADGTVYDVSILELTCDRSYCINTRSFLSQFKKFDAHNHAEQAKKYDAMSGATLSTDLTRDVVQRALALMNIMNGRHNG